MDGYTYMSQRNRITLASPPVVAPQHRQPAAAENNNKYNKQSYHIVQHRVFLLFILVIERPSSFVYGRHRFLLVLPVSMAPPLTYYCAIYKLRNYRLSVRSRRYEARVKALVSNLPSKWRPIQVWLKRSDGRRRQV